MADALESVERIERETTSEEDDVAVEMDDGAQALEDVPEPRTDATAKAASDTGEDPGPIKDQLLRLAADFENFRKRARKEKIEQQKFAAEGVLREMLPILDNLERALAHAQSEDPIVQGVAMVVKQFADALSAQGVRAFESAGQPFNPELHEAMGQAPAGEAPPGSVLQQLEKGYMIHDRLLRPAKVLVAAAQTDSES